MPAYAVSRDERRKLTDDGPVPTVYARLTAAGLPPERIAEHLAAGRIRVDGRQVVDLDEEAAPPARVVVWHE